MFLCVTDKPDMLLHELSLPLAKDFARLLSYRASWDNLIYVDSRPASLPRDGFNSINFFQVGKFIQLIIKVRALWKPLFNIFPRVTLGYD